MPPQTSSPRLGRRHLAASALLALPSILTRPARAARSITIAGYGGWFQSSFDPLILEPFRRTRRDVAVMYYPVAGSFQTLTMLREQRAYPSIDVVLLEPGIAAQAAAEGLLDPLTSAALPVINELIPRAIVPGLPGPAVALDSLAIGFNPSLIGQAPHLWRNLWDPAYGRRIAMQTPPDPIGLAMTAVAGVLFGGGDPEAALHIAMNALTQLAPQVALWDPVPDVYTAVALGDAGIGPCWNARGQSQAARTPGRFAATIPEEGAPCLATTINLVKGSPQPEAASKLIAWLLGPEAQRLLAETMCYAPVNTRAEISAVSLSRAGAAPAMAARRMAMDWVAVSSMRDQITAEWRRRDLGNR